jgi:hypothetical protein
MNPSKSLFNPNFWDCKCDENYIHRRPRNYCSKCGALEGDCPDSWAHEIDIMYDPEDDSAIILKKNNLRQLYLKRMS